jgi:predicted heme/steroid binding protein
MKQFRTKGSVNVLHVEEYTKKNGEVGYKTSVLPFGGEVATVYLNEVWELGTHEALISLGVSKKQNKDGSSTALDELYLKIMKIKG